MSTVFDFHAASDRSRLADKSASRSAVTPASRALGSAATADHHSEGIRSLCHHLRTRSWPAPVSSASILRFGQSAMTERKDLISRATDELSDMIASMGPAVPNVKAMLSRDSGSIAGQVVPMAEAGEELTEKRWRADFKRRLREARGPRSQQDMADLLGLTRDAYSKYEGSRETDFPTRLIPKFCKICGVKVEWLITGEPKTAEIKHSRRDG